MPPRRADAARDSGDVTPHIALHRHLIQTTQKLLELHGIAGITTRQIAREAKVSDGVLYNHFRDKDDLVLAALKDSFADLMEQFQSELPVAGEGDVRDGLIAFAEAGSRYLARLLPLAAGLAGHPDLLPRARQALGNETGGPREAIGALAQHLRAEQQLGRLDPSADAEASAILLFGACHVGAMVLRLGADGEPAGPVPVPAIVDALLAGAGRKPG